VQRQLDRRDPVDELPGHGGKDIGEALRRLKGFGLITALERRNELVLRVGKAAPTPDGWRVLGEWPPAAGADLGRAMVLLLPTLADETEEPEAWPEPAVTSHQVWV
jgi:hypothetical protein